MPLKYGWVLKPLHCTSPAIPILADKKRYFYVHSSLESPILTSQTQVRGVEANIWVQWKLPRITTLGEGNRSVGRLEIAGMLYRVCTCNLPIFHTDISLAYQVFFNTHYLWRQDLRAWPAPNGFAPTSSCHAPLSLVCIAFNEIMCP